MFDRLDETVRQRSEYFSKERAAGHLDQVRSSGPDGPNQVILKSPPINPNDTMSFDFDTKLTEKQAVQQFPYLYGRTVIDNLVFTG